MTDFSRVAGVAAVLLALPSVPAVGASDGPALSWIRSGTTGQCLTVGWAVDSSVVATPLPVGLADCRASSPFQQWTVNGLLIRSRMYGRCLQSDGATVEAATCTGVASQRWAEDAGRIRHTPDPDGDCLVAGASTVGVDGCANGGTGQLWTVTAVG
ncbi:ricin-type beta-trefoil lectin domain protein [Actinoplanes rectilineatus]|uniref:ricin-type beta-trefoil lectin domain protein n=1 Tax=Actinoplanes rectilineatus TaxID=113571 RepID=UPI000A65199C|nr:ricin-type beta-trefoil lectin domain protein [Actinoplanes rectilineatus]